VQTKTKTQSVTARNAKPAVVIPKRPGKLKQTKASKILTLLRRPKGATLVDLSKATEWQEHSLRGFLSGTVKKRMGLEVLSEKDMKGIRRYRIAEVSGD